MDCECENWVYTGDGRILAAHKANCPLYDPVADCLKHVYALLMAMDLWADEEDGICGVAFNAYEEARAFIGQPLPSNQTHIHDLVYYRTKPMPVPKVYTEVIVETN